MDPQITRVLHFDNSRRDQIAIPIAHCDAVNFNEKKRELTVYGPLLKEGLKLSCKELHEWQTIYDDSLKQLTSHHWHVISGTSNHTVAIHKGRAFAEIEKKDHIPTLTVKKRSSFKFEMPQTVFPTIEKELKGIAEQPREFSRNTCEAAPICIERSPEGTTLLPSNSVDLLDFNFATNTVHIYSPLFEPKGVTKIVYGKHPNAIAAFAQFKTQATFPWVIHQINDNRHFAINLSHVETVAKRTDFLAIQAHKAWIKYDHKVFMNIQGIFNSLLIQLRKYHSGTIEEKCQTLPILLTAPPKPIFTVETLEFPPCISTQPRLTNSPSLEQKKRRLSLSLNSSSSDSSHATPSKQLARSSDTCPKVPRAPAMAIAIKGQLLKPCEPTLLKPEDFLLPAAAETLNDEPSI